MDINLTNPVTTAKIGEVVNGASAATPNDTDLLPVIESSVTKKLTLTNLKAFLKTYFDTLYSGGSVTVNSIGSAINGATSATPNDTDLVMSVESSVAKKNTWTQVKAFLKTYFDTLYVSLTGSYANPTWLTSLAWSKLTGTPTTLSGYGITDAAAVPLLEYDSSTSVISAPADGGVFYSGTINNYAPETSNSYQFYSPKNSAVVKVYMQVFVRGTLATTETTTIKLLNVTSTTEETIGSITHSKRINSTACTQSTLANNLNDLLIIQCTNPSWSTNPTTVHYQWIIKVY